MPSLLARRHNFVAGEVINAADWVEELTQLYQYLTGVQSGQLVLINNLIHDVLVIQNTATQAGNTVIEFRKNDASKVKINDRSQFISLITAFAPFDVVSTTLVVGLNAEFLDGRPITDFLLSGKKVETFLSFMFDGVNTAGQETATYIVPAGTNMSLKSFEVSSSVRSAQYPDVAADFQVSLRKNGVAISALFCITPTWTNSAVINTSVVENDLITVTIDSIDLHGGVEGPRQIMGKAKFQQELIT